jgi:hypothetical protein
VWTLGGRVVQRRTAVQLELSPPGIDATFDTTGAVPAPESGPVAAPAAEGSSFVVDPVPPSGWSLAARDAFVLRQPGDIGAVTLYTSTVWAFTRGADLMTVEAGDSRASGRSPWLTTDLSRAVQLPVGPGRSVIRNDGAEIRVDLGGDRWTRVRGTVPLAMIEDYARTLRRR